MSANQAQTGEDAIIGRLVQGRFRVVRRLAAGGMGTVYEAEQVPLGRKVALKILEVAKGPRTATSFEERFFLEANAAAKLSHPNTIVVHDYGTTDDGMCFIAMEYLDGGTLSRRLRKQGPLPPRDAIHVGMQMAGSLREAHSQGLVHRDVKPGNVMFAPRGGDPLFVKVLDFGLVKVMGEGQGALHLTQSGVMMGSPRYMAPEQVKAAPCDARTDIYSFGAVFYHMLAGAPPFHAGSAFEAMQHHVYTQAPPLQHTWPACKAGPLLESIVLRCLAKDPNHRYQSMEEVMSALRDAAIEAGGGTSGVGSYLGRSIFGPMTGSSRPPSYMGGSASQSGTPPGSYSVPPSHRSFPSGGRSSAGMHRGEGSSPDAAPLRTVRFDQLPMSVSSGTSSSFHASEPPEPGGSSMALIVGGTLVAALACGIAVALAFAGPSDESANAHAGHGPAADIAPPLVPMAPESEPEPDEPEPEPDEPESEVLAAPEPVSSPPPVVPMMHLDTIPSGATVRREGSDLGDTPLVLRIPDGERWTILVALQGHVSREVTLQGGQPSLTLHLEPEPEPEAVEEREPPPPRRRRGSIRRLRELPPRPVEPVAPTPEPPPRPSAPEHDLYAPDLSDPWAD